MRAETKHDKTKWKRSTRTIRLNREFFSENKTKKDSRRTRIVDVDGGWRRARREDRIKKMENEKLIITLLTESHDGILHGLMISLGRGLAPQSEGLTSSLFCLHEITVCR
jgi:hypothetical protein